MKDCLPNRILVNGANGILGRVVLSKPAADVFIPAARRTRDGLTECVNISDNGSVDPHSLATVDAIINCVGRVKGTTNEIWQSNLEHVVTLAKTARAVGVRNFVQLSSFSVFGHCEHIDTNSKLSPMTEYGKSKLAAEQELLQLSNNEFVVNIVRVPFMFGVQNQAMMGSLIAMLAKIRFFPVSTRTVFRSMLTYSDAADFLILAAQSKNTSIKILADPQLFTFEMLARQMMDNGLKPARLVTLPSFFVKLSKLLAPKISERLFGNNVLLSEANWASEIPVKKGIENEISEILKHASN